MSTNSINTWEKEVRYWKRLADEAMQEAIYLNKQNQLLREHIRRMQEDVGDIIRVSESARFRGAQWSS